MFLLVAWIAGFGAGALAGSMTDSLFFPWLRGVSFACILMVLLILWRDRHQHWQGLLYGLCVIAGLLWSLAANLPTAQFPGSAQIIRSNIFTTGGGTVLVQVASGARRAVYGNGLPGERGRLRCHQRAAGSNKVFCVFKSYDRMKRSENALASLVVGARRMLSMRIRKLGRLHAPWIMAVLIGDKSAMSLGVREVYKQCGMYHVLVVSGMHVGLISLLLVSLLALPLNLFFGMRFLSPNVFLLMQFLWGAVVFLGALLFSLSCGLSVSTQRVLLIFFVHFFSNKIFPVNGSGRRVMLSFFLHSLVFPVGLFSAAAAMSWGAYLTYCFCFQGGRASILSGRFIGRVFLSSFLVAILAFCLFGNFQWFGFLINPFLGVIFVCVFYLLCLGLIFGFPQPLVLAINYLIAEIGIAQEVFLDRFGFDMSSLGNNVSWLMVARLVSGIVFCLLICRIIWLKLTPSSKLANSI